MEEEAQKPTEQQDAPIKEGLHDLANTLAIIKQRVLVATNSPDEEKRSRNLTKLPADIDRAIALINLLREASPSTLSLSAASVNEILQNTIEGLPRPESVTVVTDFQEDLPNALVDRNQIARVFDNLAKNSFEAMKDTGGQLTVRTKGDENQVIIQFQDTGPGIPEEIKQNLFQKGIKSTKVDGSGIGLLSVKRIVDAHKGKVRAESEPGQGATLEISLPAAPQNTP